MAPVGITGPGVCVVKWTRSGEDLDAVSNHREKKELCEQLLEDERR